MEILTALKHSLLITLFVFVMMVMVDFVDAVSGQRITHFFKGGKWRQYTLASFLGSTPGCLGAFMNVSLYVHGVISFGAIVGGMIATSGDEAFVMLTQFPVQATLLFGLLFVLGILFGWLTDRITQIIGFIPCNSCLESHCQECLTREVDQWSVSDFYHSKIIMSNMRTLSFVRIMILIPILLILALVASGILGPTTWNWKRITFILLACTSIYIILVATEHYLISHIWDHIIRRHLLRIFLWSFSALLFIHWGLSVWDIKQFVHQNLFWVLLIAAIMGLIPESGPHMIFVMMYAEGIVPFSILLTASFVQDGHGMLPLLSYSIKDSVLIKAFNLVFGLIVGYALLLMGL